MDCYGSWSRQGGRDWEPELLGSVLGCGRAVESNGLERRNYESSARVAGLRLELGTVQYRRLGSVAGSESSRAGRCCAL